MQNLFNRKSRINIVYKIRMILLSLLVGITFENRFEFNVNHLFIWLRNWSAVALVLYKEFWSKKIYLFVNFKCLHNHYTYVCVYTLYIYWLYVVT